MGARFVPAFHRRADQRAAERRVKIPVNRVRICELCRIPDTGTKILELNYYDATRVWINTRSGWPRQPAAIGEAGPFPRSLKAVVHFL